MIRRCSIHVVKLFNIRSITSYSKKKKPKPGSTPWNPSIKKLNAKPQESEYGIFETDTKHVYTMDSLCKDYDLMAHDHKVSRIFNLQPEYVSPVNLNYKLPIYNVPEFAFVGRSNVGKSSLISKLLNSDKLVRVSKEPGCTKSVNFFGFMNQSYRNSQLHNSSEDSIVTPGQHEAYLVDLPGYGFAKVSQSEKERWQGMIDGYITGRDMLTLRRVFILVDSRHGIKDSDLKMILRLDASAIPYQIVMTKIDLSTEEEKKKCLRSIFDQITAKRQSSAFPFVHAVSALTGEGIRALQQNIADICTYKPEEEPDDSDGLNLVTDKELESGEIANKEENSAKLAALKALEANMLEEEEWNRANKNNHATSKRVQNLD